MAKKTSKGKIEAIVAEKAEQQDKVFCKPVIPNKPKEDIKKYLKRKLATFGKYKQTSIVLLKPKYDPVRCTLCSKIIFFSADVTFQDEFTNKDFVIKQVCSDCLNEAKVVNLSPKELSLVALKDNSDPIVKGEQFVSVCDACFVKAPVSPVWKYYQNIPLKICYCDKCMPKQPTPIATPVPAAEMPAYVEKISEKELDAEDLKGW